VRAVPAGLTERLGAAVSTFAELGFDRTRIEDLTQATGIASSTLYYYFSGKDDVLAFLLRSWLEDVTAEVVDAVADQGSARDRLERVVREQLRLVRENPDTCRVLLAELGRIARLQDVAAQVHAAFHRPVEELLREGADDRSIRPVDVEAVTASIYGAVMIAGLHYIVAGRTDAIDDVADEIVGFVERGVR